MSAVQYWQSLSSVDKLRFVSQLALEAKRLNDFTTPVQVMKVNMNNDSEFMRLFSKAIEIVSNQTK